MNVPYAREASVVPSIRALLADAGVARVRIGKPVDHGDGYWRVLLVRGLKRKRRCVVVIPGRSAKWQRDWRRMLNSGGWPPRMYVDGNSYWWDYAVDFVKAALTGREVA